MRMAASPGTLSGARYGEQRRAAEGEGSEALRHWREILREGLQPEPAEPAVGRLIEADRRWRRIRDATRLL
jgi:hypothetical protein